MRPLTWILAAAHAAIWLAIGFWIIPSVSHINTNLLGGNDLPRPTLHLVRAGWYGCTQIALGGGLLIVTVGHFYDSRRLRIAMVVGVVLVFVCAAMALILPIFLRTR